MIINCSHRLDPPFNLSEFDNEANAKDVLLDLTEELKDMEFVGVSVSNPMQFCSLNRVDIVAII